MLTDDQLAAYAESGFVRLPGFSDVATCEALDLTVRPGAEVGT